jgi:general secretion pathway protein G
MMLATTRFAPARRRSAFTLIEVLVVVAILVILATIAAVAVPKQLDEAKKSKAQLGCTTIAKAADSYAISASNPLPEDQKYPNSVDDLVAPQWGGNVSSFLPDGRNSTVDPWGKQYQMRQIQNEDGTPGVLVFTTAPDNTPISQFGIGIKSRVN